jgi:hypothetical protein
MSIIPRQDYQVRPLAESIAPGATSANIYVPRRLRGLQLLEIMPDTPAASFEVLVEGSLDDVTWYPMVPYGEAGPEIIIQGLYKFIGLPPLLRVQNDAGSSSNATVKGILL